MTEPVSQIGLSASEATALLQKHGPNLLAEPRKLSRLRIFLRQFESVLILILIFAAIVAAVLGDLVDTIAILAIVGLNGILGYFQEWHAEQSLAALQKLVSETAQVVRDGREQRIDASQVVPGDLVMVSGGDRVPADLQLTQSIDLRIDESILTGESVTVGKDETDALAFAGTSVVSGRGRGVVTATGMRTKFGHIAELTESLGDKQTHLQKQLAGLAKKLGIVAVSIAAAVSILGIMVGNDPTEMLLTAISLAVAIVPEGLPAVVTVTLALGAAAMARQNGLVRRMQATETLGAASVICTDKTGTLTENQMTASRIWLPSGWVEVTGTGYNPAGHFEAQGGRLDYNKRPDLGKLLEAVMTCNTAVVDKVDTHWQMVGSPTEGALVTLAMKAWLPKFDRRKSLRELPFSSKRKRMSVITRVDDKNVLFCKGAPEILLQLSSQIETDEGPRPLNEARKAQVLNALREMGENGLRVLAVAHRTMDNIDEDDPEKELVFMGLVGLIDPPRPEVAQAVREAQGAGIRVIMITGDGALTALAIARQLGIRSGSAITGPELPDLSDDALRHAMDEGVVFARTAPEQKLRIVELLQSERQIVAMTGDGVNDAPALKKADIGMAMGIRGTDVAKDAADIVLLDDNFSTIISAIREGRRQFANISKFTHFLLASNAGEVIALTLNLIIGGPLIFLATQILWMNLVTDGIVALALGLEKTEANSMEAKPRDANAPMLQARGYGVIAGFGLYMALACLFLFYQFLDQGEDIARTVAFTAMVVFEMASVLAFRSYALPMHKIGYLSNPVMILALFISAIVQLLAIYTPVMQQLLHTTEMGAEHWLAVFAFSVPILLVPEILKIILNLRRRTLKSHFQ